QNSAPQVSEIREILGEQDRSEVRDVPPAGVAALNEVVLGRCGQHGRSPIGQGQLLQIEVQRQVEQTQDFILRYTLRSDALLERRLVEDTPEPALLLLMVLELLLVGADTDVLLVLELDRVGE